MYAYNNAVEHRQQYIQFSLSQSHPVSHTHTYMHTQLKRTSSNELYPLQTGYTAGCAAELAASHRAVYILCSYKTLYCKHNHTQAHIETTDTNDMQCLSQKKSIKTHKHTLQTTSSEIDTQKLGIILIRVRLGL